MGTDEVPPDVRVQVVCYCGVLGRQWADVARLVSIRQLVVYRVPADPDLYDELIAEAVRFWHENVETRTPPPPDSTEAYQRYLADKYPTRELLEVVATPEQSLMVDDLAFAMSAARLADGDVLLAKNRLAVAMAEVGATQLLATAGRVTFTPRPPTRRPIGSRSPSATGSCSTAPASSCTATTCWRTWLPWSTASRPPSWTASSQSTPTPSPAPAPSGLVPHLEGGRMSPRRQEGSTATAVTPVTPVEAAKRIETLVMSREAQFRSLLGDDPRLWDRFRTVALHAVTSNPKSWSVSRPASSRPIRDSATMGLEPNGLLGDGAIVPYRDRDTGKSYAQWQPGWQGLLKLVRNSQGVKAAAAQVVYVGDDFQLDLGPSGGIRHSPALGARGGFVGSTLRGPDVG